MIVVWLNFWTGIDGPIRSSHCDSAWVSTPPRRPNFAQKKHPNKWCCRRSLARPNPTTPEYHNVDHGVAVGRPRRYCVIEPIAFCRRHGRMVLLDMMRGCVRSCVEELCWLFFVHIFFQNHKNESRGHKNELWRNYPR